MTNEELCVLAQDGDSDARDRLLLGIMPFIEKRAAYFSAKYRILRIEAADMAHEFVVLFFKAVEQFRPEKDTKFLTYFSAATRNHVTDKTDPKKNNEIPPWKLIRLDKLVSEKDYYLSYEIPYTLEELYLRKETIMEVREALERVSKREQAYLLYRFGFLDGEQHAQDETAEHFYLNLSRARNIEKAALRHMRRELHAKNDRPKKSSIQEIREPGRLIHEDFWIVHVGNDNVR